MQIDADSTLSVKGRDDFNVADAELADRQVFLQYSRNLKGDFFVEDSYIASYQGFYLKDNGTITADNSLIQLGIDADGVWYSRRTYPSFG